MPMWQAMFTGHCEAVVQEHLPEVQVPDPQLVQAPPPVPHAALVVPGAQVPPLQQPPLQGELVEHVVEQVPPLHADPVGQSASVRHPQTPPLHTPPLTTPPPQEVQAPPSLPQALFAVPGVQVPLPPPVDDMQHPPLHGALVEHEVE